MRHRKLGVMAMAAALLFAGMASALEITYWCPFSGGDGEFMKEMVDGFNAAHTDIQVKMLNLKSEEYYAKFRTAAISGRGPDIAIAHTSQLAGLIADKVIVPVDEAAAAAGIDWDAFTPAVVEASIIDGKHMAVPLDTHTVIMFYNKKLLGDNGLLNANGEPDITPGMDGFLKFMADSKAKFPADVSPFGISTEGAMPYWTWYTLFRQAGGTLLSPDGKKADFTGPEAKQALDFLVKLVDEGYFAKGMKRSGEVFKNGKAGIIFNGIWATGDFDQTPNLEFDTAPIPRIFANEGAWADAHTFALVRQRKSDPEKEKAAMIVADWLTANSFPWAKAGQIPARKAVVDSPEYHALPYRTHSGKIAAIAQFLPNSDKINTLRETCMMYINAAVVGQQPADEALNRIETDVNRALAK